jgi:hypothetical protein
VLPSSDNESEILLYQRKEGDLERINNLWGVHMWAAFQISNISSVPNQCYYTVLTVWIFFFCNGLLGIYVVDQFNVSTIYYYSFCSYWFCILLLK